MNPVLIDREVARRYAAEADAIMSRGGYEAPDGRTIRIAAALTDAIEHTVLHAATERVARPDISGGVSKVQVVNRSSLDAARSLLDAGRRPVVLNFANAFKPGGGYKNGARAQEESLCWSSGLVKTLEGQRAFYDASHATRDELGTDAMIYSPDVPVFRRSSGALLGEPLGMSFLTVAAPNAARLAGRENEIEPAFRRRIPRILAAGLLHGHDAIVLGAWGCGAFRCDPAMVAGVFASELSGDFAGAYREVVFAILDWSAERRMIAPFERALGGTKET